MISTLRKLSGLSSDIAKTSSSSVNFNANLPVTIEVLKKIDPLRYRLRVGRKELTTKSQKELIAGKKYWANFSEGKGGILTISHLYPQPSLFDDTLFTPLEIELFCNDEGFNSTLFKTFLLDNLSREEQDKTLFQTYGYMLLALSKYVVHLPLLWSEQKHMVQFSLFDTHDVSFYMALEHLGPLCGTWSNRRLELCVMYEKSLYYLQKEQAKLGMITQIRLEREIKPLFDSADVILDIKG